MCLMATEAEGVGSEPLTKPDFEARPSSASVSGATCASAGISTRRYPVGLEPIGQRTDRIATATSESAISRRFVMATETALSELVAAPLGELGLVAPLRSTNDRVDDFHRARTHCHNVKHWQNGQMALRWCAAGMAQAGTQFRRVNGHLHLPALRGALKRHVAAETVNSTQHNEPVIAA